MSVTVQKVLLGRSKATAAQRILMSYTVRERRRRILYLMSYTVRDRRRILYFNNQKHHIINIRTFYKYVADMLQLVIDGDIRRHMYMSVNNIALYNKQEALTQ